MKNLPILALIFFTCMANAQIDNQQENSMWNILHFKGEANFKFFSEKGSYFANYEYCGIGYCHAVYGSAINSDAKAVIAAAYLFLTYVDNDQGQITWFARSPMAFALANIDERGKVLHQWQPDQCDLPKLASRVVCTLRFMVSKYSLEYSFVRYDEGKRIVVVESWDKYLTVAQVVKHEGYLAVHKK